MIKLLIIIVVLLYLVIGVAFSIGNIDYPALVTIFWFPLLIIEIGVELVEFAKDVRDRIIDWMEEFSERNSNEHGNESMV